MKAAASPRKNAPVKSRRQYPVEFKLEMIRQVREHGCGADIARQHGIPPQTLANWMAAEFEGKLRPPLTLGSHEIGYLADLLAKRAEGNRACAIAQGILGKLRHLADTEQDAALTLGHTPAPERAQPTGKASAVKRRTGASATGEWTDEEAAILARIRKLSPEFRREADRSVEALFRLQLRDISVGTGGRYSSRAAGAAQ